MDDPQHMCKHVKDDREKSMEKTIKTRRNTSTQAMMIANTASANVSIYAKKTIDDKAQA